MSTPSPDNPHSFSRPAWTVEYYEGNNVSGVDGADCASLWIEGTHLRFYFNLPDGLGALADLERALTRAFEAGKKARSQEIAALLRFPS